MALTLDEQSSVFTARHLEGNRNGFESDFWPGFEPFSGQTSNIKLLTSGMTSTSANRSMAFISTVLLLFGFSPACIYYFCQAILHGQID